MNNFWENIFRYPRFFITSFTGLIIIILTPFKGFFKTSKLRFILVIFIISSLLILYFTIKNMLGI
jgi:phosphoglycerol transferase MdoB-like AlkP superfamily enzyme